MNALQSIVDDHTARRIGNGTLPAEPDTDEMVRALYDFDKSITVQQVADTFGISPSDVLNSLNADYYCRACGRVADLWDGAVGEGVEGDRGVEFWATGCCLAPFIDGNGNNYRGPNPWAEARY